MEISGGPWRPNPLVPEVRYFRVKPGRLRDRRRGGATGTTDGTKAVFDAGGSLQGG